MSKAKIRDIELYYDVAGSSDVTLVFVHGMCGGAWVWEDQVRRLSKRFRCVTYDRRGHSRSGGDAQDQTVVGHAADLAALIEVLELDSPVVVGSSSGAVISTELICRRPQLTRGALLSEPPLFSIDPALGAELADEIRAPVMQAMREHGPGSAVEAFLGVACPALWPLLDETRRSAYRENAGVLLPTFEARATVSLADLSRIGVPTRVVVGRDSSSVLLALSRTVVNAIADARLIELEGAGHATYVEKPEAFARTVTEFVQELEQRATEERHRAAW